MEFDAINNTIYDCHFLELPKIGTEAGSITSINNNIEISFAINRVYYLYDIPSGEGRGGHSHKKLHQIIIAASGSFDLILDDGSMKRSIHLARPYLGVYLPPGLWRELNNFSSGAICLVLASNPYDEEDYIRDYQTFQKMKKGKVPS